MGVAYNITCKTGNVYKDKDGNERENTMIVGRVVTTSGGNMMAILDGLPFAAMSAKEPIVLFFNKPKDKTDAPQQNRNSESGTRKPDGPKSDDDIPF